ncbi:MTAP family purine nucleoside phosphorylase [Armatimonas sp.]|uniref:MTAP family purine nucleoside phosphorylase n=1 Tax=Armatimonas sp. TaxID=1872638 RepID=UPI00374D436B
MSIAIIGGTGVGQFPLDGTPERVLVSTRWGDAEVVRGVLSGKTVYFLARHGGGHRLPPHRINFRANIAALAELDVKAVFATTAVGSLRADWSPGTLVILDDLIDFCLTRTGKTFFDETPVHTDMTRPYSEPLRQALLAVGEEVRDGGTYLCADGPRYETAAEVRLFASWGAHVVGMTGIPEATLAREAGLHYAGISLVTNLGAGIGEGEISHMGVEAVMAETGVRLRRLLIGAIARLDSESLPVIGSGSVLVL